MKVSPPIQVKLPSSSFTSIFLSQISHTAHQKSKTPSSGASIKHFKFKIIFGSIYLLMYQKYFHAHRWTYLENESYEYQSYLKNIIAIIEATHPLVTARSIKKCFIRLYLMLLRPHLLLQSDFKSWMYRGEDTQ